MYFGGIDITYLVMIVPCIILSLWAQSKVSSTFRKYSGVLNSRGMTGADAARKILDRNGLTHIPVEHIQGNLTDHYDPKANVIRLSDSVYGSSSVAAVGVAAHEAGHAVQHAENYAPILARNAIVPVVNIGTRLSLPLLLIGMFLNIMGLIWAGIILFGLSTLFQLLTLPVELDASHRAVKVLSGDYLDEDEMKGVKKVLTAAAMTYVAALLTSAAQLLRYVLIFTGGRRRR